MTLPDRPIACRRHGPPSTLPVRHPAQHAPPTATTGRPSPARPRTSATPRCSCPTTSATSWRRCPAMMAAADATTDLRVGALVFDNDYKHPVVLAKELATIDVLSGGPVEVGLGAGWMKSDYDQSGIPMDAPGRAGEPHGGGHRRPQGLLRRRARSPSRASTTRSPATTAAQAGAVAARRSSSAAAPSGCCRSPAARPRSSASTRRSTAAQVDAAAAQNGAAGETDQKLAWVKEAAGDRYADLEINLLQFAGDRHRRPQGHRRDDGAAVRPPARGARDLPARLHRHRRADRATTCEPAASAGTPPTSCSRATRWRRWPPWSPPCATPEP